MKILQRPKHTRNLLAKPATTSKNNMPSPPKSKRLWLDGNTQNSDTRRASERLARARAEISDDDGPQITSQHPTNPLAAPQAEMRPQIPPSAPPMMASSAGSASNTDKGESSSKREKSSGMLYGANAIPPATRQEHSIYPVNSQLRKDLGLPEASAEPKMRPRNVEAMQKIEDRRLKEYVQGEKATRSLQNEFWKDSQRLHAEKESRMNIPSRPTTATSENTNRQDRSADHQSDVEISESSTSRGKARETLGDSPKNVNWDDGTSLADPEGDFTMFDDTPSDQYLVEEKEEVVYSPWNIIEPNHTPSLSALSSMTSWDPKLDQPFQIDAEWNLEKWDDFRFKVPQTPTDIESLQQALEITRMDFWVRNPVERYPEDLSQYKRESYGSQHRRLQHAFWRIWQDFHREPPPELYRLPSWMSGFNECYWKPSSWGIDIRSRAYYQGLADMAATKNERGLQSLDLRDWKARLKEHVEAVTAHCTTKLALYAGPERESDEFLSI